MPKSRLRKISSNSSMQNGNQETLIDSKKDEKTKSELRKRKWKKELKIFESLGDTVGEGVCEKKKKLKKNLNEGGNQLLQTTVRWPPFIDITNPQEFGIRGARNFYLDVEENITIGVWHILPQSYLASQIKEDQYEGLLMSGYGDSKGVPTEEGVVTDSYYIYKWIKERHGSSPVFLWGHSLGTAITTKLAKKLCELDEKPDGVILESPFNNIRDAAKGHPLSLLYDAALRTRPKDSGPVEFISFNASYRYGHKHIFKAPELPSIIRRFVAACRVFLLL
ncbi:hypothetical protein KUTeg_013404 [Tegillarca granosa]|uniref:Serine aminopeptidase S33 domain-containing protein n=1 Tax=Tegillarca granosa TaxID=220873 RepID=A0ABQ9EXJ4_TEGGR|nr:hypothetical protein KUTeg_013404 [Tegillarca granosa]